MTATTYNRNTNALKDVCTEVETQTRGEKIQSQTPANQKRALDLGYQLIIKSV